MFRGLFVVIAFAATLPQATESLRAGTELANDRAIRWTFDTGG